MTFEKVKDIIVEQLRVEDADSITLETSMMKDLEADSLDAVEIIMALEDEFEISIADEDAENFKNIGDIVKYIDDNIA
mgnify:FL=1